MCVCDGDVCVWMMGCGMCGEGEGDGMCVCDGMW